MRVTRPLAALSVALLFIGAGCQPGEFLRSFGGKGRGPEPILTLTTKDKEAGCPAGYRIKCQTEHYLEGAFENKDLTCENIQLADDEFKKNSASVCGGAAGTACPRGFWCELGGATVGTCRPLPKRDVGLSNCDPDLPYAADTALTSFLAEPRADSETVLVRVRLAGAATQASVAALIGGFSDRAVAENVLKQKSPPDTIAHLEVTRAELRQLMASDSVRQVESIRKDCGRQAGACDEGFVCASAADSANGSGTCRPLTPEQQQKIGNKGDFGRADGPLFWTDVEFAAFADRATVKKILDGVGFSETGGVSRLALLPLGSLQAGGVRISAEQLFGLLAAPDVQNVTQLDQEPQAAVAQSAAECGPDQNSPCQAGFLCRTLPGKNRGNCVSNFKVAFPDLKTRDRYLMAGVGVVNVNVIFSAATPPDEILKEIQTVRPDWPALSDVVAAGSPRKEIKAVSLTSEDMFKLLDLPAVDYVLVNNIL